MQSFSSDDGWWDEYINFPEDSPDSSHCSSSIGDYRSDYSSTSFIAELYSYGRHEDIDVLNHTRSITEKHQDNLESSTASIEPPSPSLSLSSLSSFSSSVTSPSPSPSPSPPPSPSPSPSPPPPAQLSLEILEETPKPADVPIHSCRSLSPPPLHFASPCRKSRRSTSAPALLGSDVLACQPYEETPQTSRRSAGGVKTRRLTRNRNSPYPVKITFPQVESDENDDDEYVPSSAEDEDYYPSHSPARALSPHGSVVDKEPNRKPRNMKERKDICFECSKTFTRAADLRRHMKIHERKPAEEILRDDGKYRMWCRGCHRILARIDARQRHEDTCDDYKALPASIRRQDLARKLKLKTRARKVKKAGAHF